ncbi:MAG: fibronectin type III domain-containing protein, partial [Candidatus Eisenbacteria bacterium]|nr:fibronectin type III domain-containing protein [Candidatus Eisenbacteria bacterium]
MNRILSSIRGLAATFLVAVAALLVSVTPGHAQVVNNPPLAPISIIVFPQRDFVSASGYAIDDQVIVRVIHDPAVFPGATGGTTDPANWIIPQGDPAALPGDVFAGIVEVNHPGGACWFGQTPDIRPGDRVQIEVMAGTHVGRIDEVTVANVTAKRPVMVINGTDTTLVVHGTAQDAFGLVPGNPLPLAQLEHRLIAPGAAFALNSRRGLRAVGAPATADGVLVYDPIDASNPFGINWTATYSGLVFSDIQTALGAESRAIDLGTAVAPAVGSTIFEIGSLTFAGPAAPCSAALEVLPPPPGSELVPPTAPANLVASVSFSNTVTLTWDPSTDNVGVTSYGIYRNGQAIFTVSNPDGSPNPPATFVDRNTPPGVYTFVVRAFDEVGNASDPSNTAGPVMTATQVDPNTFPVNEPPVLPVNIIAFPSRDFVSPSGYLLDDQVTVQIIRRDANGNDIIVSSATGIIPTADGFAEVNHPGGACWEGVTPEMRTGDLVRTIAYNPAFVAPGNPSGIRTIDQTHIAGVTAFKPVIVQNDDLGTAQPDGIVQIHGTALGPDGHPLPIDQIEQRMIATRDHFDFNGRRAMRAGPGSDGTLVYDATDNPMGVKWTATYAGLDADDVARMAGGTSLSTGRVFPGADTRIHWLGANPLLLNEATIFENAPDGNPPGPAGPGCFRPLEPGDVIAPSAPGSLTANHVPAASQLTLNWSGSTDDWYVAGY